MESDGAHRKLVSWLTLADALTNHTIEGRLWDAELLQRPLDREGRLLDQLDDLEFLRLIVWSYTYESDALKLSRVS